MERSLDGAISHMFWHQPITNAVLDNREYHLAWMMAWQLTRLEHGQWGYAFTGNNLYALLMLCRLSHLLVSLPLGSHLADNPQWLDSYDPADFWRMRMDRPATAGAAARHQFAVRENLVNMAKYHISKIPVLERDDFKVFWGRVRNRFLDEYNSRRMYDKELAGAN